MVRIVRLVLMVLVVGSMFLTLPACNATKGVGQDMQSGGRSLEESAKENGAK